MIDRPLLSKRLQSAYDYLRRNGVVHTITEFAEAIGKTQGDVSNALACRGRVMTIGLLTRVADAFPDVLNRDYLLEGKGAVGAPSKNMRPHFPATVQAGVLNGDLAHIMGYDVEMEPKIRRFGDYDYMIDVGGNSMEPTYFNGDSVACRKVYNIQDLVPGKVYVFVTRDGAVLKRYVSKTISKIRVSSDNPEYKSYGIESDSVLSIAEVVGSLSNTRHSNETLHDAMLRLLQNIVCTNNNSASILTEEERQSLIDQIRGKE